MNRLAILFVLVLSVGCGKQPEPKAPPKYFMMEKFNKIHNGMTITEVEGIIGRWTTASPGDSSPQKYQWKRGDHEIDVDFVDGKAVAKTSQGITE